MKVRDLIARLQEMPQDAVVAAIIPGTTWLVINADRAAGGTVVALLCEHLFSRPAPGSRESANA